VKRELKCGCRFGEGYGDRQCANAVELLQALDAAMTAGNLVLVQTVRAQLEAHLQENGMPRGTFALGAPRGRGGALRRGSLR
jgi:hypothetical protein